MNREDVIRMAREAGIEFHERKNHLRIGTDILFGDDSTEKLDRFAALVAAAERRKHQAYIEIWKAEAATAEKWRGMALAKDPMQPGKVVQEIQREAMEREREACAIACEVHATSVINDGKQPAWAIANECAAAILARNQP